MSSRNSYAKDGLCFPFAIKDSSDNGGEVVHALITNPATGARFWHAWVERDGKVYDNKEHHLSIETFYEKLKPEQVRRYKDYEAMVYAVRAKHSGPWDLSEIGAPPKPPRKRH